LSQDTKAAFQKLDSAIINLQNSFQIDPKNPETSSKLSLCYYYSDDCDNAWKYYYIRDALGGQPIDERYTKDLKKNVSRQNKRLITAATSYAALLPVLVSLRTSVYLTLRTIA